MKLTLRRKKSMIVGQGTVLILRGKKIRSAALLKRRADRTCTSTKRVSGP